MLGLRPSMTIEKETSPEPHDIRHSRAAHWLILSLSKDDVARGLDPRGMME